LQGHTAFLKIGYQALTVVSANHRMNILRFRRFDLVVSSGCVALLASFAWYAIAGNRGYEYRTGLELKMEALRVENTDLQGQRDVLEKRVRLMRPESIDLDMLDELAKTQLKMLRPNEVLVKLEN
jgi:cell division protein FtsB